MRNYINTLLSLELRKIANNQYEKGFFQEDLNLSLNIAQQKISYTAISKQNNEINNARLSIAMDSAVRELIENGASPFFNDTSGILLEKLITSEVLTNKTKYFIVESISDEDWSSLSKKHMNLIFASVAERDHKEKELTDYENWSHILNKLFEKGLTFNQGDDINAIEIAWIGSSSFPLAYQNDSKGKAKFDFVIKYVKDFDFNKKYRLNEKDEASILDIVNSYSEKGYKLPLIPYLKSYILKYNLDKNLENSKTNKIKNSPKI